MNRKIIYIYLCLLVVVGVLCKHARIIGGHTTTINEFPFVVSFRLIPINLHFCGGSIVSHWHILTAAHCFAKFEADINDIIVYTATSSSIATSGPNYLVEKVINHPDFTGQFLYNTITPHDIAIVKVNKYIEFNEYQQKIDLPTKKAVSGNIGLLLGWGFTSFPHGNISEKLRLIVVQILNKAECSSLFPVVIEDQHLCSVQGVGAGACDGDSGGPLVYNNELYGIISYSYKQGDGSPDININVYEYIDFIKSHINNVDS